MIPESAASVSASVVSASAASAAPSFGRPLVRWLCGVAAAVALTVAGGVQPASAAAQTADTGVAGLLGVVTGGATTASSAALPAAPTAVLDGTAGSGTGSAAAVPAPVAPRIEAARKALPNAGLGAAQLKTAKALLDDASALEKESDTLAARLQTLHQQQSAPAAAAVRPLTQADIDAQLQAWVRRIPADADSDTLERLLAQERSAQADLRSRIDSTSDELTGLISSPGQTFDRLDTLRRAADTATTPLPEVQGEPAALTEARQLKHSAEQRKASLALAVAELEQNTSDLRQRALESTLHGLRQQETLRAPRLDWLSRRIAAVSQARLQKLAAQMTALAAQQPSPDSRIAAIARENAHLANELLTNTQSLSADRAALAEAERTSDLVATTLRDTQARLRLGGSNATIGHWLWQQRLALPSVYALYQQRRTVESELGDLRLRLYNLSERRYALVHGQPQSGITGIAAAASEAASGAASAPTANNASADEMARWQATQVELMDQLDPLLRRRITMLEQTDAALYTITSRGTELRDLMERELLWIPSHRPVSLSWLLQLPTHLAQSLHPGAVLQMPARVLADLVQAPFLYLLVVLAVGALFVAARRAPAALQQIATRMHDPLQDRFRYTLEALGWTLLHAAPWPALAGGLGYLLQRVTGGEAWGQALLRTDGTIFIICFLHSLILPLGLAQAHLYWAPDRVRAARRFWPVGTTLIVPLALLALVPLDRNVDADIDSQTRLALMLLAGGLAVLAARTLREAREWAPMSPGHAHRRHLLVRWVGILLPAALAFCAIIVALGYVYSGAIVLHALITSLSVGLVVAVAAGLLQRWLLLGERRLAAQKAQQGDGGEQPAVADLESGESPDVDSGLTLVTVSAQTRRLVRMALFVLLFGGLLWAWSGVLPALLRFDSIVVWHSTTTDSDGQTISQAISLMDLGVSLAVIVLTTSMARNLPGLLEILLTPYDRISSSTRYTVTTLLRYAIVISGSLLGFSQLGLRWSQLQWLAAAFTVGLGFGMQEIFANFVSGLILLVERPFRVNDTVTIGDLNGTVTRIRTRATTVRDYDNKEVIIPNKTFITGQIINWSLSDTVTRIVLPVGVAYDSDLGRVHRLLLEIAGSHPRVMDDPAPVTALIALADSTINFELRAYVPELADRIRVTNDLYQTIVERFAAAGIEISFPQMDVHLRDWPPQPPAGTSAPGVVVPPAAPGAVSAPAVPSRPQSQSGGGTTPSAPHA